MAAPLSASLLDALLGLEVPPAGQAPGNRFTLEGLSLRPGPDGAADLTVRRLEAASLQLARGPLLLEIGQLAVHDLAGSVRVTGIPHWTRLEAARGELSGVRISGPLFLPAPPAPAHAAAGAWRLDPLAGTDGTIRAEIIDAHLLFDADVTVPLRQGQVRFDDATVEHVGPDSRMGASHLGLYVDAPNGRSYLYQFPTAVVPGVQFERRDALLGRGASDRGSLRLQAFVEDLLHGAPGARGLGFTEQARLLFDRTSVSGDVQLGDGPVAAPGLQAELAGRAEGANAVRLRSGAVGRGFTAEMAALSVRNAVLQLAGLQARCEAVTGHLTLRVFAEGSQWRFELGLSDLRLSALSLHR